jgi:hypothetical protein
MIEITAERYRDLLLSEAKLCALEAGGVDNWTWYDESLDEDYDEEVAKIEAMDFGESVQVRP